MFPSLVFGAALAAPAAPVPRDAGPAPAGPPPLVLHLKTNPNGAVGLIVYKSQQVKEVRAVQVVEDGKQVIKQVEQEVTRPMATLRTLTDLAPTFATAAGGPVSADEVARRARDGVLVLASADGKPVDKAWLRAVHPETVVMTADGLAGSPLPPVPSPAPPTPAPRLVLLGADADGKVRVTVNPAARPVVGPVGAPAGGPAPAQAGKAVLEDVRFDAYDLTGKAVSRAEALNRLKAGGLVLIAGDTRVPDPVYLRAFKGDLLVLVSSELRPAPVNSGVPRVVVGGMVPAVPVLAPAAPAPVPLNVKPVAKPVPVPAKPADDKKPAGQPAAKPAKD